MEKYNILRHFQCSRFVPYTPRPRPDKESRDRERDIPRTIGTLYRWASPSGREAQCGNGIPVWFCLAWNLLCSDSSILTSIFPSALFQARDIVLRKWKKPSSLKRRTAGKRVLKGQCPFWKRKSRNSYGCYATKIPADSHMITFWKLYKKLCIFFNSGRNQKGRCEYHRRIWLSLFKKRIKGCLHLWNG